MSGKGEEDRGLATKSQPSMLGISDEVVDNYMQTSQMLTTKFKEWLIPEVDFTTEIFGKGRKPTLLDPGAGKLIGFFQCRPKHRILERFYDKDDEGYESIRYVIATEIVQASTGNVVAEGVGSCSSGEKKYKYRWYFASELEKMGFTQEERHKLPTRITGRGATQYRGRNPEIPDLENTILKMASKRSEVDGCLQLPGVAAVFTQDVGDYKTPAVQPSGKPETAKDVPSDQRDVYPSPEKFNTPTWDFADAIAMQGWEAVDGIIEEYLSHMGYPNPKEAFEYDHDVAKAWIRNAQDVYLGDAFKEVDTILKIAGFQYNRNEKRWRYAKPDKPSLEKPPVVDDEEPAEEPAVQPEEPSEEEPPQEEVHPRGGPPRSVEDVTKRIADSIVSWSELVTITEYEDYYRIGRKRTLDREIEDQLDFLVSEMRGEWDKEKVAWIIPKEAEG